MEGVASWVFSGARFATQQPLSTLSIQVGGGDVLWGWEGVWGLSTKHPQILAPACCLEVQGGGESCSFCSGTEVGTRVALMRGRSRSKLSLSDQGLGAQGGYGSRPVGAEGP